jgi:hypothetical protein
MVTPANVAYELPPQIVEGAYEPSSIIPYAGRGTRAFYALEYIYNLLLYTLFKMASPATRLGINTLISTDDDNGAPLRTNTSVP